MSFFSSFGGFPFGGGGFGHHDEDDGMLVLMQTGHKRLITPNTTRF